MYAPAFLRSLLTAPCCSKSLPLVQASLSCRTVISAVVAAATPLSGFASKTILPSRTSADVFAPARMACGSVMASEPTIGTRGRRALRSPTPFGIQTRTHQSEPRRSTAPVPLRAFFSIMATLFRTFDRAETFEDYRARSPSRNTWKLFDVFLLGSIFAATSLAT